jgi:hypothetical protein
MSDYAARPNRPCGLREIDAVLAYYASLPTDRVTEAVQQRLIDLLKRKRILQEGQRK